MASREIKKVDVIESCPYTTRPNLKIEQDGTKIILTFEHYQPHVRDEILDFAISISGKR